MKRYSDEDQYMLIYNDDPIPKHVECSRRRVLYELRDMHMPLHKIYDFLNFLDIHGSSVYNWNDDRWIEVWCMGKYKSTMDEIEIWENEG